MGFDWRSASDEVVERHFNPRLTVADPDAILAGFTRASERAREGLAGTYDLRYGERPLETLDVHAPAGARGAPLVVLVHGGYWRALDKRDYTFVVPTLLDAGAVVANVNYDLCPNVTLDVVVDEVAGAVAFCHAHAAEWGADPARLALVGHSAGAHLGAAMLLEDWPARGLPADPIRALVAITGVYEPEVILRVSVNSEARIGAEEAARHDCLARAPRGSARVVVAVGGDEPAGWVAQSRRYADVCTGAGLATEFLAVPGTNHFTVLEDAIAPGTALNRATCALVAGV